jgi:uncharacterized membrane protein
LRIRILNWLFIVDILTILLVLAILYAPSNIARIILGVPFLLFFPGYTLMAVLFVNKEEMDRLEKFALSFGISVAVVALIGFGLNYSTWGIKLEPVLISVASFIIVMSEIALIRLRLQKSARLTMEFHVRLPSWEGGIFSKSFSIILFVCILGALGFLGHTLTAHYNSEIFTEFYILGDDGKAERYPTEFIITQGQVTSVSYDSGLTFTNTDKGNLTLGIVSHEKQETVYYVNLKIDGLPAKIDYQGTTIDQLSNIDLQPEQKWEQTIGFAPQNTGANQKVELFLFKDQSLLNSLTLWINVN